MSGRTALPVLLAALALLSGCASGGSAAARLAPRAAEAIDPRVPIPSEEIAGPADPALAAELARLTAVAASSTASFETLAATARGAAAAAGPAESESWIDAQERLSAAIAARAPVTRTLGDLDSIAAKALAERGRLNPGDRKAIEAASEDVGAIDRRQAETIAAIAAMLAR